MVFQGGSAIPVYNIDASQLVENGGDFRVIGYLAYAIAPPSGTDFTNVNQIQFNTSYIPTSQVAGTIYWNEAEKTLNIVVDDNVVLQAGQEILLPVRNQSGVDIGDGAPVMYAGTTGNSGRTLIQPAIADGSIDPSFILGLATEPIPNNSDGFVTWFGKVREINTTGVPYGEVWIDGDIIYVSATTAGYLSKTPPDAPNYRIQIAAVMNSAVNGVLTVRSTWNSKLTDLADVNGTPLTTTGQFPTWDNGNQYFDFTSNVNDLVPKDGAILSKVANYQLAAGDEAKIIECNGTFTITLPNGLDVGFQAVIVNVGTGTISLSATTTLQSKNAATDLANQYGAATVYHRGSNVWIAIGDLS